MTQCYAYQKLVWGDSIRLLTIRPGEESTDLFAKLEEVRLEQRPDFEAMSYVWGEKNFNATVHIEQGNSQIRVTSKLASALQHFRDQHQPRTVWVDAICIDQTNEDEKAHQVSLMSQIYSIAKQVVIWMEEGNAETDSAVQCLKEFAEMADNFDLKWDPDGEFCVLGHLQPDKPSDWILEDVQDIVKRAREASVFTILRRAWFRRLWVIQEVLLAKTVTVLCGTKLISWPQFAKGLVLLNNAIGDADSRSSLDEADSENIRRAITIAKTRSEFRFWGSPNAMVLEPWSKAFILGIYETFRNQQCDDDRDRVFGFLSLRGPEHGLKFTPNYRWTVPQAYKRFALSLLRVESGCRHLFDHAGIWHREDQSDNHDISSPDYLPSWAPDFRPIQTSSRLPRTLRSNRYQTASNFTGATDFSREDENILRFRGKIFDDILVLAECGPEFAATGSLTKGLLGYYVSLDLEGYPTGENAIEAFLRTIVLGSDDIEIERLKELWEPFQKVALGDASEMDEAALRAWIPLHNIMVLNFTGDSCVVTKQGFFGVVPFATRLSDRIAIVAGSDTPFVVRWAEDVGAYLLIGACYIHGLMAWDYNNPVGEYVNDWISFA